MKGVMYNIKKAQVVLLQLLSKKLVLCENVRVLLLVKLRSPNSSDLVCGFCIWEYSSSRQSQVPNVA